MQFQNGAFTLVSFARTIDVQIRHVCSFTSTVPICCITKKVCTCNFTCNSFPDLPWLLISLHQQFLGEEHKVCFVTFSCEPLVVTMVRANLWPSSPKPPHLAFIFELLDWIEALFLECQVALKDFCQALLFKAISPFEKVIGHLVRS